jgi:hypothetical protein
LAKGRREAAAKRLQITTDLINAIQTTDLPSKAVSVADTCYRKRHLIPNNPINGGDMVPLIYSGCLEEGVASWTTDPKFAQEFKDLFVVGQYQQFLHTFPSPMKLYSTFKQCGGQTSFLLLWNTIGKGAAYMPMPYGISRHGNQRSFSARLSFETRLSVSADAAVPLKPSVKWRD